MKFPFARLLLTLSLLFATAVPSTAQEIWSVGDGKISLEMGEAKFIRLPSSAKAVFLSNPKAADIDLQSARYLYIVGQQIGETNLFVLGENDEEVMSTTIEVTIDTAKLTRAANASIEGGRVTVRAVDGAVFLDGVVKSELDVNTAGDVVAGILGESALVVNKLTMRALPQVNLQVRIAEVSRSISEDLGISLTAQSGNGRGGFNAPGTGVDGFNINVSSGTGKINLVLDALARNGLVSILSEPNLTARSGEAATFLAGGRIPYPERSENGEITYRMEPIGVELEFTPTVRDRDQIEVALTTRVRDIDDASSTNPDAPNLSERSATTTVELGSGQSFAIAGMFSANSKQSLAGLPGMSKLPVIGALFRSSRFARGETELVIIVTPYLVRPGNPDSFATPLDNIRLPKSGLEQAVSGELSAAPLRPSGNSPSRLRQGGFILE